jgi:RHS repeat-associated protein
MRSGLRMYAYDLVGNILRTSERVSDCGISGSFLGSDALDRIFTYDPLYRLLSATGRESDTQNQNDHLYTTSGALDNYPTSGSPNSNSVRAYARNFAYDKMGNVQQVKQTGTNGFTRNFNYQAGSNTLNNVRTASLTLIEDFTCDANGNQLTAGATRNNEWDHADRLRAYYNQAGSAEPTVYAQYVYDGSGSRVKKFVRIFGGDWESVTYIDGVFEHHKKLDGGTEEKNHTHVDGGVDIRTGSYTGDIADTIIYQLADHLNSVSLRLNATGGIIDREEYYPYGDSSLRTFTQKRYRFTGKEKDAESGLYYYGARYYSAWTCQFLSVDAMAGGTPHISPYAYGNCNPIMFNDPTGNSAEGGGDGGGGNGGNQGANAQEHSDNIRAKEGIESSSDPKHGYVIGGGTVPSSEAPASPSPSDASGQESKSAGDYASDAAKWVGGFAVDVVEGTVDGVVYLASSFISAFVAGVTYGAGDLATGNGSRSRVDLPAVGFSFDNPYGFKTEEADNGDRMSFDNGVRVMSGVVDVISAGAASAMTKVGKEAAKQTSRKIVQEVAETAPVTIKRDAAFFSGHGTRKAAEDAGFETLGQTEAGKKLAEITEKMLYEPDSPAWLMWGELSAAYARGVPNGSRVHVFLTKEAIENPRSIWNVFEKPVLQESGRNIEIVYNLVGAY